MEQAKVDVNCAPGPRPKQKLLERAQEIIRLKHYSIRTERAYLNWMRRYILFHHKRHPQEMGPAEIEAFLTHLAMAGNVARSTQNQAFNASSDNSHSVEILQLATQRSTWFAGSLPEQKRYANFIWEQTKESIAAAHACRAAGTAVRKQAWRGNPRT